MDNDLVKRIEELESNQVKVTELLNLLLVRYDNIVHKLDFIESLDKGNLVTLESDIASLSKEVKKIYEIAVTGSSGFRVILAFGSLIASILSAVTLWIVISR